jgi:hypothetical protein
VSIATLGDAMTAAGMPPVADKPGWTRIVTVLSRSVLRERLVGHIQTALTGCPVSAVFAIEATHLCEPPIVRFLPEGVQVDVRIRPIQWGGGDTLWTTHRLLYPLRPLNSEVVFREPSHIETSAPLQASGSGYLDRLIGANPVALQPLTWELAVLHARRFGNACLFPDPSRAVFGELSGVADALEVVFHAPVNAVPFESCQLPFPVEGARKPPG